MTESSRHELEDAATRVSDELYELTKQLKKQRKRGRLWIGGFMVVLIPVVLVLVQGVYFSRATAKTAECQAKINRELRTVAEVEREDYNETWQKILDSKNQAESRAVFTAHLVRRKAAEAERNAIVKKERNADRC